MLSNILAATDLHVSLKAEPVFDIGPFTVTNSMIYGLITGILLVTLLVWAARKIKINGQKGFSQIPEVLVEFVLNLLEGPLGSRKLAVKYAPIFAFYFVFIIFTNMLELVPWVGPGVYVVYEGIKTPLFRPFTADLNGTIAMSVIAIIMVQYLSVKEQGGKKHLQHYFSDKPHNPINFFIGILEVFGEFTRILSLSLRLFLNTAVGEILISVFTSLVLSSGRTPVAVIPIFLFETLVAGIQAYVFTILCATYLGLAISHAHEHDEDHQTDDAPKQVEEGVGGG
ncbi:F0F1 ATP synthase subunit A [Candidatus Saccharibacteria bacterium]|nr:F0F1 ATP synthase subunit A [Candidatus Saccharibacteria bacterium]